MVGISAAEGLRAIPQTGDLSGIPRSSDIKGRAVSLPVSNVSGVRFPFASLLLSARMAARTIPRKSDPSVAGSCVCTRSSESLERGIADGATLADNVSMTQTVSTDASGAILLGGSRLSQAEAMQTALALVSAVRASRDRNQRGRPAYYDTAAILARANDPIGRAEYALRHSGFDGCALLGTRSCESPIWGIE